MIALLEDKCKPKLKGAHLRESKRVLKGWWKFIVCTSLPPPPLSARGGGGRRIEPPTKLSKRGRGLTGPQFLEGGDFWGQKFFLTKIKLKSGIFI